MQTEETLRNKLRYIFDQHNQAKLVADGIIVPNLILNKSSRSDSVESNFFTLSFITTANKLYTVEL